MHREIDGYANKMTCDNLTLSSVLPATSLSGTSSKGSGSADPVIEERQGCLCLIIRYHVSCLAKSVSVLQSSYLFVLTIS